MPRDEKYNDACMSQVCFFKYDPDAEYHKTQLKLHKESAVDLFLVLSSFLSGACLFVLLHSHLITVFSPWMAIVFIPLVILGCRALKPDLTTNESPEASHPARRPSK